MAKTVKKQPAEIQGVVIKNITITPVNRSSQSVTKWRQALISAEGRNPQRTLLYDLYADILLDAHLSAVIDKRKHVVTNSQWQFVNADGKINEAITGLIRQPWFRGMLNDIMDTPFWGHTAIEMAIVNDIINYYLIPRKHIEPTTGIIKAQQSDGNGLSYREPPLNQYVFEVGDAPYFGLLLKAAPYVIYKRGGFGDWAQFAEMFGMPFRKGTYDGYDENARLKLTQALDAMGSASYAVIPEGSDIELIQNSANSGSNVTYKDFIAACDAQLSKLILGQTMTTEQGENGARAMATVHQDVEDSIHMSDILYVANVLNFPFKSVLAANGLPVEGGEFQRVEKQYFDAKTQIAIDKTLKLDMGLPIADDYLYETYGIPKPENYDELKAEGKADAAANFQPAPVDIKKPGNKTPLVQEKSVKAFLAHLKDFFS